MKYVLRSLVIMAVSLFFVSCNSSETASDEVATDSVVTVQPFAVEQYYLGLYDGTEVNEVPNNVFKRGDKIYFSLRNVTGMQRGGDGLFNVDVSMEITNSINELVANHSRMYGDSGHRDFENEVVKKPFASFLTDMNMPIGTYNFNVKVLDLVGNDSLMFTKQFILE